MKLSEFIEKYGDYEVTDELMDMVKEDSGEWRPKNRDFYWYIDDLTDINIAIWNDEVFDIFNLEKRNVYRTKAEAEKALEMYEFCRERSFRPDWNDETQRKYYLYLDCDNEKVEFDYTHSLYRFLPLYYPTEEAIREIINKYSFEELEKYYGRV